MVNMKDEELKYYKALQPVFKKKMGGLSPGDRIFLDSKIYLYKYQKDKDDLGIYYCTDEYGRDVAILNSPLSICPFDKKIYLPLPIDPENPERGLIGMLAKDWLLGNGVNFNGYWVLHQKLNIEFDEESFILAMLKALAAQEGIAV